MCGKFQYIQRVKIHLPMVEMYQQFLLKLGKAYDDQGIEKPWKLYEEPFGKIKNQRKKQENLLGHYLQTIQEKKQRNGLGRKR